MDRDTVKSLRVSINEALKRVKEDFRLETLEVGNATFDPHNGRCTFKLEVVESGGLNKEASTYDSWASIYDWPPRGSKIKGGSNTYEIVGVNARKTKFIVNRVSDGKTFLYPCDTACALYKTQQGAA